MTSKHTPGPWDVRTWGDGSSEDGFTNVVSDTEQIHIASDVLEENARLIAAAPDLYEALKRLEYWFDTDQEIIDAMNTDERADHMRQAGIIRAALNKVEGKT